MREHIIALLVVLGGPGPSMFVLHHSSTPQVDEKRMRVAPFLNVVHMHLITVSSPVKIVLQYTSYSDVCHNIIV